MKTIKKAYITITLALVLFFSTNLNGVSAPNLEKEIRIDHVENVIDYSTVSTPCGLSTVSTLTLRDCTITISGENYELEVTFHDVSWWTCVKLHVGAWWNRTF